MQFDKKNWKPFKLIDVLTKKEENDRDNAHKRFERFLKVEHLDAECLHIKRWANQEEEDINPTFYKIFRKGQVLFPTRNPHLRRTAVAAFDGICGEKTLTLEPNESLVLAAFIPFLFHSERFYAHTVSSIIGSTNPHCRWRDVANYEFLLPPKEEQEKLVQLLCSIDDVIEKEKLLLERLNKSDLCQLKRFFYDDQESSRIKLKNVVELRKGKKPSILLEDGEGLPYCTTKYLRTNEIESLVPNTTLRTSIEIDESDILILWDGSNAGEVFKGKKGILASTMCKLVFKNKAFDKDFIFQFLRFRSNDIKRATIGSAIPHVDSGIIENIEVPLLKMENQKYIVALLDDLLSNINLVKSTIVTSQALQKNIINQIFK